MSKINGIEIVGESPVIVGDWVKAFKSFTGFIHIFRINKMDKKGVYYVHGKKELFFDWDHTVKISKEVAEILELQW